MWKLPQDWAKVRYGENTFVEGNSKNGPDPVLYCGTIVAAA
jgi:hypothetical protein